MGILIAHFSVLWDLRTSSSLVSLAMPSQQCFFHPFEVHKAENLTLFFHYSYCITMLIVENSEKINKNPLVLSLDITDINVSVSFSFHFTLFPYPPLTLPTFPVRLN